MCLTTDKLYETAIMLDRLNAPSFVWCDANHNRKSGQWDLVIDEVAEFFGLEPIDLSSDIIACVSLSRCFNNHLGIEHIAPTLEKLICPKGNPHNEWIEWDELAEYLLPFTRFGVSRKAMRAIDNYATEHTICMYQEFQPTHNAGHEIRIWWAGGSDLIRI